MKTVDITELAEAVIERKAFFLKENDKNEDVRITLHDSCLEHNAVGKEYDILVNEAAEILFNEEAGRNDGTVQIAFLMNQGANEEQIDTMAKVIAVVIDAFDIDLNNEAIDMPEELEPLLEDAEWYLGNGF